MNRRDVVSAVADRSDLPFSQVDQVLTVLLDVITEGLRTGEEISIRRFGKWEPRKRRPVTRKNPRTGEDVFVAATKTIGFIPSVNLKAAINQKGRRKRPKGAKGVKRTANRAA